MMRTNNAVIRRRATVLTIARAGLVAVIALLAVGCANGPKSVVVSAAHAGQITVTAAGPGVSVAAVDVPVVLGFRGTITTVDVGVGQKVVAGQPLVGVSSSALENVAGKLGARAHALAAAVATLARAGASASAIASAQAQATLAQNAFDVANAGRGEIRSPITGTVADVKVTPGSSVYADQPLVHVVDLSQLTVSAELATTFMGRVHQGMSAVVRADGQLDAPLAGVVTQVSPVVSSGGQTFTVVVAIDDPAGAKPGLHAYVSIPLTVSAQVAVNKLAVLNADSAPTVFVVEGSQVRQRSVGVGLSDGITTEIVSGLRPGESVVIAGAQVLSDGTSVTVSKGQG